VTSAPRPPREAVRCSSGGESGPAKLFEEMMTSSDFAEFLTLGAYEHLD
jgi:hypothetical protein